MVKSGIRVIRNAQHEAEIRTLAVSEKPGVGVPIITIVEVGRMDGASSFSPQFDGERYIHGKLREFTLRSAAHREAAASVAQAQVPHVTHANRTGGIDEYLLIAQNVSSKTLHEVGCPSIQSTLGQFVLAHMLRAVTDAPQINMNRVQLCSENSDPTSKSHSKRTYRSTAFSKMIQSSFVDSLQVVSPDYLGGNNAKSFQRRLHLNKIESHIVSSISFGAFNSSTNSVARVFDHHRVMSHGAFIRLTPSVSLVKCIQGRCFHSRIDCLFNQFSLKDEEGFGTAPIWYQQSMATGPPTTGILAGT